MRRSRPDLFARLLGASLFAPPKLVTALIAARPSASGAFVCAAHCHALVAPARLSPIV